MSGYDSWLEAPYDELARREALFEKHIESCEKCAALEDARHTGDCDQCGHDWHQGPCTEPGCECPTGALLKDSTIEDMQGECANNAALAAEDAYWDRRIDEARGK